MFSRKNWFLLLICSTLSAQVIPENIIQTIPNLKKEKNNSDYPRNNYSLQSSLIHNSRPIADNSIDEESYYIGGGDHFSISLIDFPSHSYEGKVNQNNDLHIPEIGVIKLGRITLSKAKDVITRYFQEKVKKNTNVYVSLINIKESTVYINGMVSSPGRYVLPGTMRLLDALKCANEEQLPPLNDCDYRDVKSSSRDTTNSYDLLKYILSGDLSQNPYIYPGDNITLNLASNKVYLTGAVKSIISGSIPVKPNETVGSFLSNFKLDAAADSGKIILQTSEDGVRKALNLKLPDDSEIQLKDRDLIIIPNKENYTDIAIVSVSGEAVRPGAYPTSKRSSTVKEILNYAGGNNQFGDLSRAVVIRRGKIIPKELSLSSNNHDLRINATRPEINSSISLMNMSNDFAIIPITDDNDIYLEPGDEIYIPRIENFVYVSGAVKRPGGYEYKKGKPLKYYIEQAGGFDKKADKANITVVTRYSDILQITDGKNIQEGNIIVVPISQQNKVFSSIILPVIQAVATTIGMLLAIYATVLKE